MKMSKSAALVAIALLAGCSSDDDNSTPNIPEARTGEWLVGDLHVHSAVSNDARDTTVNILYHAFDEFDIDYVFFSNHMRDEGNDHQDNDIGRHLYANRLKHYELPELRSLQRRFYEDKILTTTFEWDFPGFEHYNIAIVTTPDQDDELIEAVKLFEYKFSEKNNIDQFDPADVARWEELGIERYNTSANAAKALTWLKENFPENSYGMLNHPRRYADTYTLADVRDLNNLAPNVFFLMEGMVGGQFHPYDRGDYAGSSAGLYGGADPMLAEVGGWWDALLSEGRRIWNVSNSDYHFKISANGQYTSGYYPGEYSKNYTFVTEQKDELGLLEGLRSGEMFGVTGDIINALDFTISANGKTGYMGQQDFTVSKGDEVTVSIRFQSPDFNNQEIYVGDGIFGAHQNPGVHHVDVISGSVTGMVDPTSEEYSSTANSDAQVVASFTEQDWYLDDEGYYSMSKTFIAEGDQYFRLRGTALDYNEYGLTVDGEPQKWEPLVQGDEETTYQIQNRANRLIYRDVWFYSNPVYVNVK
ncbi:hypothetical protein GT360_15455 [Vibrio astriarenae]|uniref:S-layer protein n=1 Tax=Vibrio astriarenae TaxID=1481923 RepID=A0A7Z2T635_9VIBR|nr:hypothetical protein [Vibrio astriarenae]QIA64960.1 hypothetical protein GT360_15455 [Vibrio astriarenae]